MLNVNAVKYPYRGQGIEEASLNRYEPSELLKFYHEMLRIRRIEEKVADKYHEDEMKTPIHLAIGQEGVAVGSCSALTKEDLAFCGHRTHGVYLAKGGDLNAMFSEFHCRINGCAASRGGSMHLLDKSVGMAGSSAIVAGIIPIATGSALAAKQKGEKRITTVYLGDAAAEEGACWESLNFAKLKELPILYICENNYYSVCSPLEFRQPPGVEIYKKAEAFGLNSQSIDGNNVIEVFEATQRAKESILTGEGPAFIEAHTYRWRGHHGAGEDYQLGYRSKEELDAWKEVDPIRLFEDALRKKGILSDEVRQKMEGEIDEEVASAFKHALSSPFPTEADLLTHVYSE